MKTWAAAFLLMLAPAGLGERLRVTETAGIRRFGYPVTIALPSSLGGRSLQLLESGKPVAGQFRGAEVDFNVSLGPYEQGEYTVAPRSEASAEPAAAVVRKEADRFAIGFTPNLQFFIAQNLLGFLHAVKTSRWD